MEDDWIRTALFVDADNVNVEVVAEVIRRLEAGGARRLQHRRVYGSLQKAQEFALLCQQHAMRFVCTTYAGTNGTDRMVGFMRNKRYIRHMISQMFRQMPPQYENMEFSVDCTAKTAGVVCPYPLSVVYADGI